MKWNTRRNTSIALLMLIDREQESWIEHWVLSEFVPRRADSRCFPALCSNLKWKCYFFSLSLCFWQWSSPWRLNALRLQEVGTWELHSEGASLGGSQHLEDLINHSLSLSLSLFEVIAQRKQEAWPSLRVRPGRDSSLQSCMWAGEMNARWNNQLSLSSPLETDHTHSLQKWLRVFCLCLFSNILYLIFNLF